MAKPEHNLVITEVEHYNESLFRIRTERPQGFRFRSGEFVMIGLEVDGKPVMRAYSIASPAWADHLEFYSIKVPDGPLTSRLQNVTVGDTILMSARAVGTLVYDALTPAKNLYLFATGTGVAPFASIVRDLEVYDKYQNVFLVHSCRNDIELTYSRLLIPEARKILGMGEKNLASLMTVLYATRDGDKLPRIPELVDSGYLEAALCEEKLNPTTDRVMICGSMAMNKSCAELCEKLGFKEGSVSRPGEYVIEKAFVG